MSVPPPRDDETPEEYNARLQALVEEEAASEADTEEEDDS